MTDRQGRGAFAAVVVHLALLAMAAVACGPAVAAPLRHGGRDVELSVTQVSDRTVRIRLTPSPAPADAVKVNESAVLAVRQWPEPALRVAELDGPREAALGALRVRVTPSPLACEVLTAAGQTVQRLTFGADDGAVAFPLGKGPLLGLGEGAQQFDRRGALYPMEPSWGGWNRPVLGSVVPSPYLIGTSGIWS
jgi:hypothetical protein